MDMDFNKSIDELIGLKDPAEFLKTEKFMEAWYCLKNDNVTVIVDSIRPRVLRIYSHGKFGDFQNLLYNTNAWSELTGEYGIVPYYEVDGQQAMPFIPHAYCFENFGGKKTVFDKDNRIVNIHNINCFIKGDLDDLVWSDQALRNYDRELHRRPPLDFGVQLDGDELVINLKYPPRAEKGILRFDLYPRYTHYTGDDGKKHCVEYMRVGIERTNIPRFDEVVGRRLVLNDVLCGLPRLTILSDTGVCRLISNTDWSRNNAASLNVTVETNQPRQEVRLRLEPNPVTVKVYPLVTAGKPVPIEIWSREVVRCRIDNVQHKVKQLERGKYSAVVNFAEGEHTIIVRTPDEFTKRVIYAVDVDLEKITAMSDALIRYFWTDTEKKNIIAYAFNPDTLEPLLRDGFGFSVHAVRALTTLFLGAVILKKPEYADKGYNCLKALVNKSHAFENGDLLMSIGLDKHGKPNPETIDGCRPSDLGIMIRGFLYAARAFRYFKREDKRTECLDYAKRYAGTYARIQREDGSFYSRYSYPDLKPTTKSIGTVNNWMIQVWHLAEELETEDPENSKKLRKTVNKFVDFCILKRQPSILEISGGADEGPANYHDDLATSAVNLAIKYLCCGEARYRTYAEQALKMSFCCRNARLDSPYDYLYPLQPHMGFYHDFPFGVPSKGDMTDLTGNEAALFLKRALGYDFGEYMATYCTACIFTDSYNPNGVLYAVNVHVPNYTHIMKNYSDVNVYGAVGVVLFWLFVEGQNKRLCGDSSRGKHLK